MSINWIKFNLRPGTSLSELRVLADLQANSFRKAYNWSTPKETYNEAERSKASDEFVALSQRIIRQVDFSPARSGDELQKQRIYPIAYNSLIPWEWREYAKRTILPGELKTLLQAWKQFVSDTRAGFFEDYHHKLFMYEDYNPYGHGYLAWEQVRKELYEKAELSKDLDEEWTQDEGFLKMVKNLAKKPVLALKIDIPDFSLKLKHQELDIETEAEFAWFKDEIERLMAQVVGWNRCVPEGQKIKNPSFIPVQIRLQQRRTNETFWLEEFFHWADEVIEEGCGLFLYF